MADPPRLILDLLQETSMFKHLGTAGAALAALVLLTARAFAQDAPGALAQLACADDGFYLKLALGLVLGSSALASGRRWIGAARGTAWLLPLFDLFGGNLDKLAPIARALVAKAGPGAKLCVAFALVGGVMLLAACSGAPALPPDVAAFATQVKAFDADFRAKASATETTALTVGRSACGLASELNGLFGVATTVAATISSAIDPEVGATEAVVFAGVKANCALIDAFDPAQPISAQVAQAIKDVVTAIPTVRSQIAAVSPAAASASTAAAAGTHS
jgi:hypothetical protein